MEVHNKLTGRFGFKQVTVNGDAGGFSAENTFLQCDGLDYVLKCFRTQNENKIRHLEASAKLLFENGLPVPLSLEGRDGKGYFEVGGRFYSLMPKVRGIVFHEPDLCEVSLEQAGRCLGIIHNINNYQTLGKNPDGSILAGRINEESIIAALNCNPLDGIVDAQTRKLLSIKRAIIEKYSSLIDISFSPQISLIHGDFHNQNLLFNKYGTLAALLDFELVDIGSPQRDIMSFIHLACCNSGYRPINIEKVKSFLGGYRQLRSLDHRALKSGMFDWMVRMSHSLFIESKVYIEGCTDLAMLITRDEKKLGFLLENAEAVVDQFLYPQT
jgi:Ser/Thr protein kinase RdoA (MazF antagonist)